MTLAQELAAFAIGYNHDDLPDRALVHAKMLIASTIASAAMGSTLYSSKIMRALEVERGGRPEATIWFGAAERLPAIAAARINAIMSDAAASDDSDLRNIVHQGTTACCAALAIGERTGADGKAILSAVVMGYEVAGRISTAIGYGYKQKGFHGSLIATFAATVAAARLLGLSETQAADAICLTAVSGAGLMAASNTSIAREYFAGQAVVRGMEAAFAAGRGFAIEPAVLECPGGYFDTYGVEADISAVMRDAGSRWSILADLGIKLVPGGHPQHSVAEAAAQAAIRGDIRVEEIEAITISRPGFQGFANHANPTDLVSIAQSAIYFAAAGAADRDFGWEHATSAKINDPRIRSLFGKVRLIDPPTEQLDRYRSGAVVTIHTHDGRSHSATVYAPKGAAMRGIEWEQVAAKFLTLVPLAGLADGNVAASIAAIQAFSEAATADTLIRHLR